MSLDLIKFIKVMKMTGSSHEGEALAALRTATRMMAAAKVTWDDIIKPSRPQFNAPPPTPNPNPYTQAYRDRRNGYYYNEASNLNQAVWEDLRRREQMRNAAEEFAQRSYSKEQMDDIRKRFDEIFGKNKP